jgi:hypothetical protein
MRCMGWIVDEDRDLILDNGVTIHCHPVDGFTLCWWESDGRTLQRQRFIGYSVDEALVLIGKGELDTDLEVQ